MLKDKNFVSFSPECRNLLFRPLAKTKRIPATASGVRQALLEMNFTPHNSNLNSAKETLYRDRMKIELNDKIIIISVFSRSQYIYDTYSLQNFRSLYDALTTLENVVENFISEY
jgi:hypothetical protein